MSTLSKQQNKETGDLGETVACRFLESRGYTIVGRNYWRKWGEIDIIAKKNGQIHFIEVKTVSHETRADLERAVARGTWRPEEQVHQFKLHQIHKALETWVSDNSYEGEWQIDVIAVRVVPRETFASVNLIENITN